VDVLEAVRRIRARCDLPLLLFSYFNPLLRYGLDLLARDAIAAGADGSAGHGSAARGSRRVDRGRAAAALDTVFLAAPTQPRRAAPESRTSPRAGSSTP
jgi:tryptophan synthase alpha chain